MMLPILRRSLLAFCNSIRQELQTEDNPITVVNYDAYAELEKLPTTDTIGIRKFSVENDEGLICTVAIVVSTLGDETLDRLNTILDAAYEKLTPGKRLNLVHENGALFSQMTVMDGTTLLPMYDETSRPVQAILVRFGSDLRVP